MAENDSFEEGDLVLFWTPDEAIAGADEAIAGGVSKHKHWPGSAVPWGQIGIVIEGAHSPSQAVKVLFPNESEPRGIGPAALTLVEHYDPVKELGEEYFQ